MILLAEPFAPSARAVLERVGEVAAWDESRLPDAEAVVTGLEVHLRKPLLERMPRLRVIASRTSQLRHLDLEEARRRGIEVLSIEPDAPALQETSSTAEETFALLLALVRNVPWAFDAVKAERWERRRYGGHELKGKTLGVIGYGRLGKMVAGYARAFGMRVLVNDPQEGEVSLEELLRESDVVSVHCTFDETTRGLLGEEQFRAMKPTAYFVNTARGEIIDENALARMLEAGELGGVGLDVFEHEPAVNPRLLKCKNAVLLPHMGSATIEGRIDMGEKVIINFKTFADGHTPPDRVLPSML